MIKLSSNFIRIKLFALVLYFVAVNLPTVFADDIKEPDSNKVRIAIVQMETLPGAVEKNRAKAVRFAEEAIAKKADIILFHEALVVGYVTNIHELAEPVDGPTTQAFQKSLQGTKTLILYGLVERDDDKYYTSAVLVGADGVEACYRKTHLWWCAQGVRHEPTFFLPGDKLVTFDVKGHKCGVMICYDGDFPEMTRAYANLDCEMLFWMNNRRSRGHGEVHSLASRNTMIMATSCCCGKDESGYHCPGASNITAGNGSLLTEILDKEGIIYADIDPSNILKDRQNNYYFRGQRQDLYRVQ